jgi:cation transport regulator
MTEVGASYYLIPEAAFNREQVGHTSAILRDVDCRSGIAGCSATAQQLCEIPVGRFPGETIMPYQDISDLPQAQVDQYDRHQKEAFLKAFNSAYEQYNHDESRAFAVAHHAAKQAGRKEHSDQH